MPGQTAAAHGARRSGGVFPQYSSLWSGVLPRISETSGRSGDAEIFSCPAFPAERDAMRLSLQEDEPFFLAQPVFSLMLGGGQTGPTMP